jgi:hypothetical protein
VGRATKRRGEITLRQNIVLIDFESVQPTSLNLLGADHFKVKVFVGATQTKLPFDLVTAIQQLGARAEYIKIAGVGPNALDFHIAYYIGRIACQDPEAFFHVISKDAGFDPLLQHLKEKNILCRRWQTVEEIPAVKTANVRSPEERADLFLSDLRQSNAGKPVCEKGLRNAVAAYFLRQLTDDQISAVIGALQGPGRLAIADGKVEYAAAA